MRNIVFIAPPAAGKGTQSALLKEKYNLIHISMGELLRNEVSLNTDIGKKVKSLMEQGILVEGEIVFKLLEQRLTNKDCENGYILDGFPRDLEQAIEFDKIALHLGCPINYAIVLNITKEESMKRITGRLTCPSCGAIYNEYFDTFKKQGFCNNCSTKLTKRSDDNEETFNHRFDTYINKTQPVIDYYRQKGILYVVDSGGSKEYTFSQIESIIGGEEK